MYNLLQTMRTLGSFFRIFMLWTLVGLMSKVVFLLAYHSLLAECTWDEQLAVIWYGLRLDFAMAGYLTLLPGLMLAVSVWYNGKLLHGLWKGYLALTSIIASLAYVANIGLYGYWGFPLDNTPILYIRTSPADAAASLVWWQLLLGVLAVVVVATAIYLLPFRLPQKESAHTTRGTQVVITIVLLLLEASLILPIRGGVGTGTNHTGSVYFSTSPRLNHAAVNPMFSFMESVLHQQQIGTKYRFMTDDEANRLMSELTKTTLRADSVTAINDSTATEEIRKLRNTRPNIILITLEGFSDTVMRIKNITPNLERLTHEGLYFTNFYTNSFRTDRALVSVHSGLPAQTTMSVMDNPRISTSLPSIAGTLSKNGYATTFYYGGDINYSNMRSYFVGTGFQTIVSDKDFPRELHTGKWGVADGAVYDRIIADIKATSDEPFFLSIMTESSHEPFDVPNYKRVDDEVLNAFSYADDCLGRFITQLKELPCWDSTIVVIVPDHLGAFPSNIDNYQYWRYHAPLIILGGMMKTNVKCDVVGSQIDISATLFGLLGISHEDFTYSKDLLDNSAPHFAFFTFPDAMGMISDSSRVIFDNTANQTVSPEGAYTDSLTQKAKAYLQKLYDDIDKR